VYTCYFMTIVPLFCIILINYTQNCCRSTLSAYIWLFLVYLDHFWGNNLHMYWVSSDFATYMYFRQLHVTTRVHFLNSNFIFDSRFDFLVLQNVWSQIFVLFDINHRSVDSYFDHNLQLPHTSDTSLRYRQIG